MDDEQLLGKNKDFSSKCKKRNKGICRQRHEGNLDFLSFTDLMYTLLNSLWGEDWGTFAMEKPKTLDTKDVQLPIIVTQLQKMMPGKVGQNVHERTPRLRGGGTYPNEETGKEEKFRDYGQRIDTEVTFSIFAESNLEAIEISQALMDIVHNYKGVLQRYGVQNIWFTQEETLETKVREDIIARKITYHTTFEKIYRVDPNRIKEISINAETLMNKLRKEGKLPSQQ